MMLEGYKFSNSQTLSNLSSTGEVGSNTWDLEENAMVDDMVQGYINVTVISAPAQATIAGTEGVQFEARTAALTALASLPEIVGAISVLPAKVVAGAQFAVPVFFHKMQKQFGIWARAVSTSVVGDIVIDADFHYGPAFNTEDIQIKRTSV